MVALRHRAVITTSVIGIVMIGLPITNVIGLPISAVIGLPILAHAGRRSDRKPPLGKQADLNLSFWF